jgi:hypothetical protein
MATRRCTPRDGQASPRATRPAGSSRDQRTETAAQDARALAAEAAQSLATDPKRWHHKRTTEVSRRPGGPGERRSKAMP